MGNCSFCHNNTLTHQNSIVQINISTLLNAKEESFPNSPQLSRPDKSITPSTSPLSLIESSPHNKKITTPVPTATTLSQKAKCLNKRNSRFSSFSNHPNITIYIVGPYNSGKTSLIQSFWNGLLHPFNANDPYIHTETEEIVEKKFHSNSKQYDFLFKVPNTKEIEFKRKDCLNEFICIVFAVNEIKQFEEAKEMYENVKECHWRKKEYENGLSWSNVIMIGMKCDLEWKVGKEEMERFVKEKGLMGWEMTLKEGKRLNAFLQMVVGVCEQHCFVGGG